MLTTFTVLTIVWFLIAVAAILWGCYWKMLSRGWEAVAHAHEQDLRKGVKVAPTAARPLAFKVSPQSGARH